MGGVLTSDLAPLVEELRRFPIVFVHAGCLFNPQAVVDGLIEELSAYGRPVTVHDVRESLPRDSDSDHVLVGFDALILTADRCERLAQLRASAMVALDDGRRLIALSRPPKARLLGCPGSQLILDARTKFLAPLTAGVAKDVLAAAGVENKQAVFAAEASSGLPALIAAFLEGHTSAAGEAKVARGLVLEHMRRLLREAFTELGPEVTTAFHRVVEQGDPEIGADLDPLIVEAFRGAGVAAIDGSTQAVRLQVPDRIRSIYVEAARSVIDSTVEPPEAVTGILAGLWEIERRLRYRLQRLSVDRAGNSWRSLVMSDAELRTRILERVSHDRASTVSEMEAVANPLEWMTLDELLQLIEEQAAWACPPEAPVGFFRRMRSDLPAVRNRAAHCRLPELRDGEVVERWRLELRRRFPETPGGA